MKIFFTELSKHVAASLQLLQSRIIDQPRQCKCTQYEHCQRSHTFFMIIIVKENIDRNEENNL